MRKKLTTKTVEALSNNGPKRIAAMTKLKLPFVTMSNIEELEIDWLLEPYLPRGALIALEGNPGQGKSTFCAALVGAITGRHHLPFGKNCQPGTVLLFCAEDDPARVLKRRLKVNGAELSRVRIQQVPSAFDKKGLALMRTEMARRPPALVIIDPFVAYLDGDTDLNSAAEMTRLAIHALFSGPSASTYVLALTDVLLVFRTGH